MIKKIGIFDSGIGGLSVYREIKKILPSLDVDYFADHAFLPYGNKSLEEIQQRCTYSTELLLNNGAQLIVVACNTATALAIDFLRQKYPTIPFVGVEPFVKYIENLDKQQDDMALLLTVGTANSERFNKLKDQYDPHNQLTVYPCPGLAHFIEDHLDELFDQKHKNAFMKGLAEQIQDIIGKKHTHLILGCTHYPLVQNELTILTGAKCISPEPFVAQRVLSLIGTIADEDNDKKGSFTYTSSANKVPRFLEKIIEIKC